MFPGFCNYYSAVFPPYNSSKYLKMNSILSQFTPEIYAEALDPNEAVRCCQLNITARLCRDFGDSLPQDFSKLEDIAITAVNTDRERNGQRMRTLKALNSQLSTPEQRLQCFNLAHAEQLYQRQQAEFTAYCQSIGRRLDVGNRFDELLDNLEEFGVSINQKAYLQDLSEHLQTDNPQWQTILEPVEQFVGIDLVEQVEAYVNSSETESMQKRLSNFSLPATVIPISSYSWLQMADDVALIRGFFNSSRIPAAYDCFKTYCTKHHIQSRVPELLIGQISSAFIDSASKALLSQLLATMHLCSSIGGLQPHEALMGLSKHGEQLLELGELLCARRSLTTHQLEQTLHAIPHINHGENPAWSGVNEKLPWLPDGHATFQSPPATHLVVRSLLHDDLETAIGETTEWMAALKIEMEADDWPELEEEEEEKDETEETEAKEEAE